MFSYAEWVKDRIPISSQVEEYGKNSQHMYIGLSSFSLERSAHSRNSLVNV